MNNKNIVAILVLAIISIIGFSLTKANTPLNKAKSHFNYKLKELRNVNRLMGEALLSVDYTKEKDMADLADMFSYHQLNLMEVVNLIEVNIDNKNRIKDPSKLFLPQSYSYYKDQILQADKLIASHQNELKTIDKQFKGFKNIVIKSQKLLHELIDQLFFVYKFRK